jgi:hypothetical protein
MNGQKAIHWSHPGFMAEAIWMHAIKPYATNDEPLDSGP